MKKASHIENTHVLIYVRLPCLEKLSARPVLVLHNKKPLRNRVNVESEHPTPDVV